MRPPVIERDFTLARYAALLTGLTRAGYRFRTFERRREPDTDSGRQILLRHDVDRLPGRAAAMAALEYALGIQATYFFRLKPGSFHPTIIRTLADQGHEIGYHYEDLADTRGDHQAAWELFKQRLDQLRAVASVTSIAMHGRPLSPWDARALWQSFDYRTLGIHQEAYFDLDWSPGGYRYFTDTGRSWNHGVNLRDRPPTEEGRSAMVAVRSTHELLRFLVAQPGQAVISNHPERWTDSLSGWGQVWLTDAAISLVKRMLATVRRIPAAREAPIPKDRQDA